MVETPRQFDAPGELFKPKRTEKKWFVMWLHLLFFLYEIRHLTVKVIGAGIGPEGEALGTCSVG